MLGFFFDSTPWVIGGGGLNASAEASTRTPPLHQRDLLSRPSFTTTAPLPESNVVKWLPLFGSGFELRCFQLLSATAWLPGDALSDNR